MSQRSEINRGELALTALRYTLLAGAAALVGVLVHVVWKIVSA